jgi:hypothetical protein
MDLALCQGCCMQSGWVSSWATRPQGALGQGQADSRGPGPPQERPMWCVTGSPPHTGCRRGAGQLRARAWSRTTPVPCTASRWCRKSGRRWEARPRTGRISPRATDLSCNGSHTQSHRSVRQQSGDPEVSPQPTHWHSRHPQSVGCPVPTYAERSRMSWRCSQRRHAKQTFTRTAR